MRVNFKAKDTVSSGGSVYFQNSKNTEIAELQAELNSMKLDQQKEAMKQIIASMTIGKDVSALFPHVVKCMRTTNVELKKLIYLYIINYAKAKPELTFLAVAAFHSDANDKSSPLIRALAVRTMGCIRVNMIVSYLCETLTNCLKDEDAYVRKTAAICVAKLYNTSPNLVKESGFINTLVAMLVDGNAVVVANALSALAEISVLSGENLIKIKSKSLKRVLLALKEANEWSQVYILDALTTFTPKKQQQAEDIIEAVIPRLSHANPSVVMSSVKVILKFLDHIDNIDNVRNYCKKLSNSLMTIMMAGPEIQYVLLRSLHAVVQKRPLLLDKDFKFFFVQYNDPIYVKLEKIDILYKLCDNKNYESIINEFKSYSMMEFDTELVRKSVRYIGYIGYKYEKSLDLCVASLEEILDHSNESTVTEGIIVARDLMRKYQGRSLELLKKITADFIGSVTDPEAKSAVIYIIGEFSSMIKNSTELITPFVENYASEDISPKVKLQILNAVIKNFVNKPDDGDELVKICLEKGAEESENPDVRDRAYIYWRIMENNPDLAREMLCAEKPPFDFIEDNNFDAEMVDNIIENMTNVSSVYHKLSNEVIIKEDMIVAEADNTSSTDGDASQTAKETEVKDESVGKKSMNGKKKEEVGVIDADLLGLDEDVQNAGGNIPKIEHLPATPINIFDILSNTANQTPINDVKVEDFGFVTPDIKPSFDESAIPVDIFTSNSGSTPSPNTRIYQSNDITIYSSLQRDSSKVLLGLFVINKTSVQLDKFSLVLSNNSFGLTVGSAIYSAIEPFSGGKLIFSLEIDNNKNDKNPPSCPYKIIAKFSWKPNLELILSIPAIIGCLFSENGKMANKAFVEYFQLCKDKTWNAQNYIYQLNEDIVTKRFEKDNIFLVAKQTKFDPPLIYYSLSISQIIPVIIEAAKMGNGVRIRIISNVECISPLVKEALDIILA